MLGSKAWLRVTRVFSMLTGLFYFSRVLAPMEGEVALWGLGGSVAGIITFGLSRVRTTHSPYQGTGPVCLLSFTSCTGAANLALVSVSWLQRGLNALHFHRGLPILPAPLRTRDFGLGQYCGSPQKIAGLLERLGR